METQRFSKEDLQRLLPQRAMVSAPGTIKGVRVGQISPVLEDENRFGGQPYRIYNLDAMTSYHLKTARDLIAAGKYDDAYNQRMTINIPQDASYKPLRGERVVAQFGFGVTKSGEKAIWCDSVRPEEAVQASQVNVNSLFGEEEPATETPDFDSMNLGAIRQFLQTEVGYSQEDLAGKKVAELRQLAKDSV